MTDDEVRFGHASDCAVHNEPAMPNGACEVCGHARGVATVRFHRLGITMRYCAGASCLADLTAALSARSVEDGTNG